MAVTEAGDAGEAAVEGVTPTASVTGTVPRLSGLGVRRARGGEDGQTLASQCALGPHTSRPQGHSGHLALSVRSSSRPSSEPPANLQAVVRRCGQPSPRLSSRMVSLPRDLPTTHAEDLLDLGIMLV